MNENERKENLILLLKILEELFEEINDNNK